MKKLIAMIGAVATAFGLFAATEAPGPFATSFETRDEGVSEGKFTPGAGWTWGSSDALTLGVYADDAYTYGTGALGRRDDKFVDTDNLNYLKLETGANTLTRDVNDNVFLDQLVKFTGFEEYQTNVVAGTKIAVWMSGIEGEGTPAVPAVGDPEIDNGEGEMIPNPNYVPAVSASDDYVAGETNLYITCAKVVGGKVEPVALKIAGNYKLDTWYRLTIKSLGSIYEADPTDAERAGFIVYIDGQQVAAVGDEAKTLIQYQSEMTATAKGFMADGALFPAIDTTDATFTTVGYQGIGEIDDIIIDTEGPEFARSVNVTAEDLAIAGAKIVKVEQDGVVVAGINTWTVKPGDIVVYYAPDGAFVIKGAGTATWTASAQGAEKKSDIDIVAAAAQVVDVNDVTNYVAETELFAAVALVEDGDEITFLQACSVTNGEGVTLYTFPINTTVDVAAGGNWDVMVPGTLAELYDNVGAMPEKQIKVTFPDDLGECTYYLAGNVYGNGRVDTSLEVVGFTLLNSDISVGDTLAVEDGAGAVLKSNFIGGFEGDLIVPGSAKITLVGKGKVVTTTQLVGDDFNAFTNEKDAIEISEADSNGFITYQLKGSEPPAPTTGFAIIIAEGNVKYFDTLQDAIDAAGTDDLPNTVTILEDCALDARVAVSGKTVTLAAGEAPVTVSCANDRVLDIRDNATVTIGEGVTLTSAKNPTVFVLGTAAAKTAGDETKSTLVVNGTIANTNPAFDATFALCGNGDDFDGVDITIGANGVVSNANGAAIYFPNPGTLTVNGTVEGYSAIIIKDGELVVNNGATITATGANYYPLPTNTDGASPSGDAIVAGYYSQTYKGYGTPVIEIKGGTISVNPACEGAVGVQGYDYYTQVAPDDAKDNIEVAGGTFNTPVAEDYCASGYIPKDNGDGTYGVKEGVYVARVNGQQGYETLAAAFADAQHGETIELLDDLELTEALTVAGADAVLDLKGFTLTTSADATIANFITVEDSTVVMSNGTISAAVTGRVLYMKSGAVTIGDELLMNGSSTAATQVVLDAGTLNVYGSIIPTGVAPVGITVEDDVDKTSEPTINIYDGAVITAGQCAIKSKKTTAINVYGGTFTSDGNAYAPVVIKRVGNKTTLNFEGGTFNANPGIINVENEPDTYLAQFEKFTAENCGAKFNNIGRINDTGLSIADFVADGYELVEGEDNYYTIQKVIPPVANVTIGGETTPYTDLHAALVAGSVAGAVVELVDDVDLTGINWEPIPNFLGKFDGKGYTISNLKIDITGSYAGIFGDNAWGKNHNGICNLVISNADVKATGSYAGVLAAKNGSSGGCVISNVTVCGSISVIAESYVGGLVGHNQYNHIIDCHVIGDGAATSVIGYGEVNEGVATGSGQIGGLVGMTGEGNMHVWNCSVEKVSVKGVGLVGAIWGRMHDSSKMVGCTATDVDVYCAADVATAEVKIGTLVGGFVGGGLAPVIDCTATNVKLYTLDGTPIADRWTGTVAEGKNVARGTGVEGDAFTFKFSNPKLTAGTFEVMSDAALTSLAGWCQTGYAPIANGDGTYTIMQAWNVKFYVGDVVSNAQVVANGEYAKAFAYDTETIEAWTNAAGVAYTEVAITANTDFFAQVKAAPVVVYPEYIDLDDADMKKKYDDWSKEYGADTDSSKGDAFLWNADPTATLPTLKIESIAVADGVATIVVSAEGKNLQTGINGVLYVSGCNALGGKWVTTVVDATADSFPDGKATFTVEGAQFMKAKIGFKAETPAVK